MGQNTCHFNRFKGITLYLVVLLQIPKTFILSDFHIDLYQVLSGMHLTRQITRQLCGKPKSQAKWFVCHSQPIFGMLNAIWAHPTMFNPNYLNQLTISDFSYHQPFPNFRITLPITCRVDSDRDIGKVLDISFGKMRPHLSPIFFYCEGFPDWRKRRREGETLGKTTLSLAHICMCRTLQLYRALNRIEQRK